MAKSNKRVKVALPPQAAAYGRRLRDALVTLGYSRAEANRLIKDTRHPADNLRDVMDRVERGFEV